jgi:hypothetical protein
MGTLEALPGGVPYQELVSVQSKTSEVAVDPDIVNGKILLVANPEAIE